VKGRRKGGNELGERRKNGFLYVETRSLRRGRKKKCQRGGGEKGGKEKRGEH